MPKWLKEHTDGVLQAIDGEIAFWIQLFAQNLRPVIDKQHLKKTKRLKSSSKEILNQEKITPTEGETSVASYTSERR